MKKKSVLLTFVCLLTLALAACSNEGANRDRIEESIKSAQPGLTGEEKGNRKFLTENGIEIRDEAFNSNESKLHYPVIHGLLDQNVQNKINSDIKSSVLRSAAELSGGTPDPSEKNRISPDRKVNAGFSMHGNYNNVLSISEYFYIPLNETGQHWVKTLNYRLDTGERLELKDLFRKGADYRSLLNSKINEQIINQNLDEYSMRGPFEGLGNSQEFFITDNMLVIFFNPGNQWFYTPYQDSFGLQIPFNKLEGLVDIFDKYANPGKRLYEKNDLKIIWLPNDLDIQWKKIKNSGDGYNVQASYIQIRGTGNRTFENEINRMMEERAREFVQNRSFIKTSPGSAAKEEPLAKIRHTRVTANFAGKLCILEEDFISAPNSNDTFLRQAFSYDIEKGKLLTLKDLFNEYPEYQKKMVEITKKILGESGYNPDLIGDFDSLAEKTVFFFDQHRIILFFKKGILPREDGFAMHIDFHELGEKSLEVFSR